MVTQNMFSNAIAFNQPLGTWTTTSLSNLFNMFNGASSFNQSLGDWKISSFGLIRGLLDGTNLSTANYDQTLIDWSVQDMVPIGLVIDWENDGIIDESVTSNFEFSELSHTYSVAGDYQVAIFGSFPFFNSTGFSNTPNEQLISIDQWGTIEWELLNFSNSPLMQQISLIYLK